MVLGDIFTFWSKKCDFLTFCSESAIISIFTSKVHFDHFLAKKAIFCLKSDFGRQSAIWELREPPAGSRDRPRREPRGGVPGDPSESGPGEKTFENKAKFSNHTLCYPTYN